MLRWNILLGIVRFSRQKDELLYYIESLWHIYTRKGEKTFLEIILLYVHVYIIKKRNDKKWKMKNKV